MCCCWHRVFDYVGLWISFPFFDYSLPRMSVSTSVIHIAVGHCITVRVRHVECLPIIVACGLRVGCWIVDWGGSVYKPRVLEQEIGSIGGT